MCAMGLLAKPEDKYVIPFLSLLPVANVKANSQWLYEGLVSMTDSFIT